MAPFVDLAVHAIGEHLGDWPRAYALGRRLLAERTATVETGRAWEQLYVAAALGADAIAAAQIELAALSVADDKVAGLFTMRFLVANALIGAKRFGEGGELYRRALEIARHVDSAHVARSIAVASNNLAWELYELPSRTADEAALMQLATDAAYTYWLQCGTWINEERALHLKSVVALATGDTQNALLFAEAGLAIITANGERPIDAERLRQARAEALA